MISKRNYFLIFLIPFFFIIWMPKSTYIDIPPQFKVIYITPENFDAIKTGDWVIYINFVPRSYYKESYDIKNINYGDEDARLVANTAILDVNTFDDCVLASYFNPEKTNSVMYIRNGVVLDDMRVLRRDLLLAIDYYFYKRCLRAKDDLVDVWGTVYDKIWALVWRGCKIY